MFMAISGASTKSDFVALMIAYTAGKLVGECFVARRDTYIKVNNHNYDMIGGICVAPS